MYYTFYICTLQSRIFLIIIVRSLTFNMENLHMIRKACHDEAISSLLPTSAVYYLHTTQPHTHMNKHMKKE